MLSPLHSFADRMITFKQFRNSQLIAEIDGLKNTETGTNKKIIEFFPNTDIQIGDMLINSDIQYFIVDKDTQTWHGQVGAIKAYYQTIPPKKEASSNVYNISNPQNSIIGNQQSATINNSSFNIDDLKNLIELYGNQDKQQLYELTSQLQEILKDDNFHKSKLSKFSDLIAKHSWLPLAIAQVLAGYLQSH